MEMMFSWLKYLKSFISLSVRRQNIEWSKGVIFLIATFCPEGLWSAELRDLSVMAFVDALIEPTPSVKTDQTTP